MDKFILKSGKVVELAVAPIDVSLALYRAIISECKKADLDFNGQENFLELLSNNIPAILNIIGSEEVFECIEACCEKVVYDKKRFSKDLFEDIEARQDYFGLMQLVAIENIRPFFLNLHTVFNAMLSLVLKD